MLASPSQRGAIADESDVRPPVGHRWTDAEWALWAQLVDCYHALDYLGWSEMIMFNSISVRLPAEQTYSLVNPFGLSHAARLDAHCIIHTQITASFAIALKQSELGHDDFYGVQRYGRIAYHALKGI